MATAFYSHPDCLLHEMGPGHPECPERLAAIEDQLIASRIAELIERESAPLVDIADIARVHTRAHIDFVERSVPREGHVWLDPDTAMNPHTWQAALRAAGAAVAATDAVIEGRESIAVFRELISMRWDPTSREVHAQVEARAVSTAAGPADEVNSMPKMLKKQHTGEWSFWD